VMFTLSWMLTSLGLHQLLIHYPERPWAVWAARKKFLISRLGDILLLTALSLTFYCFGSFEYGEIFGKADAFREDSSTNAYLVSLIATLYVLGAMTKSAQFPFHSWLPDTMETPTPVSALMHAGIINAGGFLIIRLSPLVSVSDLALDFLTIVGAFTALLGAVVMITQSSIKRALAYSTVAQMGFMMFQCGLGAFSAALLHIVAHSLYKAHAFLSSGSVLEGATGAKVESSINPTASRALSGLAVAALVSMAIFMGSLWLLGIDLVAKPGGPVLGVILVVAMTQLLWRANATGLWTLKMWGIGGAVLVCVGYLVAYLTVDRILSASVSNQAIQFSTLDWVMAVFILFGFLAVFALQAMVTTRINRPFLRAFYVHALNGFYLDIPARRITARFWGHESPTP
ncbi:MAG: hypothetical protein KC964_22345, partial [Candidatus Omnitrophica bacterium]|nr:hypothetical protein [Candidatus Omnitrophota bacterium]